MIELMPVRDPIAARTRDSRIAMASSSGDGGYRPYLMDDVRRASSSRAFTGVSMFAGGGGSSIGYRLAGGHVLLANEFVPEATRTYRANNPGTPVDTRDIRAILADHAGEAFLAAANLAPGELDVLDGSVPCCEFSNLGRRSSDQGELRPYSDVRQRGMATLIFDFFELATIALPKVVIGENIPSLATRHGDLFHRAIDTLRFVQPSGDRLYYAGWVVLTASDFGVPQKRQRLFFIAVRKGVAESVGINSDADIALLFPDPTYAPVSVASALANLPQTRRDIEPWQRAAMVHSVGRLMRKLPPNPPRLLRPRDVELPEDRWFSLVRCAWDLPAPTLAVAGQAPDGRCGVIHPEANRKFTIPELKRLFGLPDDYVLTGTVKQASERICRMVPPLLTKAIAERVRDRVLLPFSKERP